MRAKLVVVYCTHCHTVIRCYVEGLENLSRDCAGCTADLCSVFSVDEVVGRLCSNCNWTYDYPEDCYGHA